VRLDKPRIQPVAEATATAEQKELLAPLAARGGPVLNVFRTLINDPEAAKAFLAWGNYILSRKNGLPPREREIVILRIGYLCRSGYEWTQHHRIGLQSGLSAAEIERIKAGPAAPGWTAAEAALLKATDELHNDTFVSDDAWTALRQHFSEKQCMDMVFTAGQYTQVSMFLNSFGVQLDEGQVLDPDLAGP